MDTVTWIGICICLAHSATFSGLNLALFGLTRLRLEVEAESGNDHAVKILNPPPPLIASRLLLDEWEISLVDEAEATLWRFRYEP